MNYFQKKSMKLTSVKTVAVSGFALALCATLAGCASADEDLASINPETQLSVKFDELGLSPDPDSMECDGELEPTTGESTDCEMSVDGQPVGVSLKVTEVDGAKVDVEVETHARPVSQEKLEETVRLQVIDAMGAPLDAITCEGELKAEDSASTNCSLTADGVTRDVTATVTSITGGLVEFALSDR